MAYLYNTIVQEFGKRELARTEVPNTILDNLRPVTVSDLIRLRRSNVLYFATTKILRASHTNRFICFTIWQQVVVRP